MIPADSKTESGLLILTVGGGAIHWATAKLKDLSAVRSIPFFENGSSGLLEILPVSLSMFSPSQY